MVKGAWRATVLGVAKSGAHGLATETVTACRLVLCGFTGCTCSQVSKSLNNLEFRQVI